MATKLAKTGTPGIYRRHAKGCEGGRCDCAYVAVWRHNGAQRKGTFSTLAEAREGLAAGKRAAKLTKGHAAGLHDQAPAEACPDCDRARKARESSTPALHEYARSWIDRYHGTGRRGFREETREEYRSLLDRYALAYFSPELRLIDVTPREVAEFVGWLVQRPNGRGGTLSDKSIRNALAPLAACMATARREGLIVTNPTTGAALPTRPKITEDEELPRPFPPGAMELVVELVHPKHRAMFELLAATGLRRSELLAIEGRHLSLSGERPVLRVRQRARVQKGRGMVIGPLKSRHARRDLPLSLELADRLAALDAADDELVFRSRQTGRPYDPRHLELRVLSPACAEAGVEWAGFHTFRHTVASLLFAEGRNAVEVQRWLGHHSPSFTLDTYVHLLEADLGAPLMPLRGNKKATERPEMAGNGLDAEMPETALLQGIR